MDVCLVLKVTKKVTSRVLGTEIPHTWFRYDKNLQGTTTFIQVLGRRKGFYMTYSMSRVL